MVMEQKIRISPLIPERVRKGPVIIAGPCSAESEEQVLATAIALQKEGRTDLFRAGVWKPRTRPGSFEGAGEEALPWLNSVQEHTGLKVAIEIANPEHAEKALKAGIRYFWIGARTVVSPFSVQEIANALGGIDVAVMVKNPVNPDINLWIGALERLNKSGITRLAAIHRGFSHFESAPLRNKPIWELPITLKRLIPELPVFTDPSHICGATNFIREIAQKALDLEMNGLMIETHINPAVALTDAKQQITPSELSNLLTSLSIRSSCGHASFDNTLRQWRELIDEKDDELLNTLSSRFAAINEIGKLKKENNVTILQLERWKNIVDSRMQDAEKFGINPTFMKRLLNLIHEESIRIQEQILNNENKI